MKRLLTFNFSDDLYVIQEDNSTLFSINSNSLKFDSLNFYNSIYKGKSALIEIENIITSDPPKKGGYVFNWLSEIINKISSELGEADFIENDIESLAKSKKEICLFDLASCAGNGFYMQPDEGSWTDYLTNNHDADFAVNIRGKSMEPEIPDQSIVLVKSIPVLSHKDIGIFFVNNESMCKQYIVDGKKTFLKPINLSDEYHSIELKSNVDCHVQGKVIEVISN